MSILGHELGHWKMSHTLQQFVITQSYLLASFCAFGLATELGESLRLSFGYSTQATLITLYLFFAVVRTLQSAFLHHTSQPVLIMVPRPPRQPTTTRNKPTPVADAGALPKNISEADAG